jgi:flagellar motility protein MotE (MotC chaperone)
MDSQVRLLPAVIGAAVVIIVLRLAAMSIGQEAAFSTSGVASASNAAAPAAAEAAAPEAAHPAPDAAQTAAAPAAPQASASDKPADAPSPAVSAETGQAQSKGEADVLRGLSDRRGELDARENEISLREQLLAATQRQVDEKIAELKQIQSKLDAMLAQRDEAQKAQLTALVKMYENMKPPDAAKIFEKLDRRILADVAGGMKPAKVGAILAAMDPVKAQELTALLANRLILPEPQPVVAPGTSAAAPPSPAAIPAPEAIPPTAQSVTPLPPPASPAG